MTYHLENVLATLGQHQQRATYSAVAELVGETPRSLMRGKARTPEHSWIVSKTTGRPTGYADADVHPSLASNHTILATGQQLREWLASHNVHDDAPPQHAQRAVAV